jgi:hypothetical protein
MPNIRPQVFKDIAEDIWMKYEHEIFKRLEAGEKIHGNRFVQIRREMEGLGCPKAYADKFIQNQLYDMREQIELGKAVTA